MTINRSYMNLTKEINAPNDIRAIATYKHYIVVAARSQIEIWDQYMGLLVHCLPLEAPAYQVHLDDERLVAGLINGKVQIWSLDVLPASKSTIGGIRRLDFNR